VTGHDWCCSGLLSSYSASGLVPVPGFRDLVSPVHQLLQCTEVSEVTQSNLLRNLSSHNEFLKEILFSSSDELHKTFIERVQFLKGQHESVINDLED